MARPARGPGADALAAFFHGLSHPDRVRVLLFLASGPKTAGEIVRHLGRRQPSVSSHLMCLRQCGYVEARREGREVVYALIHPAVRALLRDGARFLDENAERILACRVIASERGA